MFIMLAGGGGVMLYHKNVILGFLLPLSGKQEERGQVNEVWVSDFGGTEVITPLF